MSLTISRLIRVLEAELLSYGDMSLTIGHASEGQGATSVRDKVQVHPGYYLIMSKDEDGNKHLFVAGNK